ncbi:MAG: hypothetical protein ACJ74T_01330, partial [Pyrinomonadaceae bacterium]
EIVTDFPVKTSGASATSSTSTSVSAASMPPTPPMPPAHGAVTPPPPPVPVKKSGKDRTHRDQESARLDGTVGTGDAVVNLSSFSGSLHLRKR